MQIYSVIDLVISTPFVITNYLQFKTLYFEGRNPDALFLNNVLKNKIEYLFLIWMLLVSAYLSIQVRNFLTYNCSNVSRSSLSTRCFTAASNICRPLNVHNKHTTLDDNCPLLTRNELRHYLVTYITLLPRIKFDSGCSSSLSLAMLPCS